MRLIEKPNGRRRGLKPDKSYGGTRFFAAGMPLDLMSLTACECIVIGVLM